MIECVPGLFMPLHISIPADGLTQMSSTRIKALDVAWIAPPPTGSAAVISVLISGNPLPAAEWPGKGSPGTTCVGVHTFLSGRTVWVLGLVKPLSSADVAWLTECAGVPVEKERAESAEMGATEISRIILPCVDHVEGTMALWDVGHRYQGMRPNG
jgi:hypothetical protein